MICSNCKKEGSHYVPPSFNETGFYICKQESAPMSTRKQAMRVPITTHGCECGREMCATHVAIAKALADARRAVWEEAAKAGDAVIELLYRDSPAHRKGGETVVETIRAQAAQEENG